MNPDHDHHYTKVPNRNRHIMSFREYSYDKEPFYYEIKRTNKNVPEASPRVVALSAHKEYHSDYQFDWNLPTDTKPPKDASPRVEELARYGAMPIVHTQNTTLRQA